MTRQLKENASIDRRNYLITKSLPVIKGEKTLQEFRKEMEELFNNDFIKDDRNYRNQIKNYYFQFEKEFLPRFQKEIAETGQIQLFTWQIVIKYSPDVRRATDLSLPKQMDKKQEGGLTGYQTGNQTGAW